MTSPKFRNQTLSNPSSNRYLDSKTEENGIKLSKEETAYIKTRFSKSGRILYKQVLARIAPDLTLDDPSQRKWVLRIGQTAKSTVRDFLHSRNNVRAGIGSRGGAGVSGLQYLNVKEQKQPRSSSLVPELSKGRAKHESSSPLANQASSHPKIKKKPLDPIRSSSQLPQLQSNMNQSNKAKKSDSITSEMVKKYMQFPFDGKGKKMVQMYRKQITNEDMQKQLQSKFIYDHQRNYDVVTNQYYDYASPDQYKTKGGYKPKYQDDYTGVSVVASDDGRDSRNQQKKNTKISMYLAAKHKNNPQFFTQLQQAAKQQNVAKLIHKMMNQNIDPRQVIGLKKLFLKEDPQGKGCIEEKVFRKLFRASISKYQDTLQNQFTQLVKDEKQEGMIEFQKLLYFVDLYQFFPYIVKKDRNFSADLYNVLSNGLQPGKTVRSLEYLAQTEETSSNLHELLQLLWVKIDERFSKIGSAFRYFDTNSNGLISRAEFQLGIQNLHVNLQRSDIDRIFNHMDQDKDNYLSYSEFCQLLEEKRRGLDPGSKLSNASPTSQTSYGMLNKTLDRKRSIGDDASSFMETMGKNPNLNNSDIAINKHLAGFKLRKNIPKTLLPSMHDAQFTYGVPTIHPDSINDVMSFNYQKQWLEKLKVIQDQQEKMNPSNRKLKNMKQFQTRASKIRAQALLNKIKQDTRKQMQWEGKLNWKMSKFKNAKPTQEIINQYRENSEYNKSKKGSSSSSAAPWLNKKMALLKQSVPDNQYQPQSGALLRDDLAGNIMKHGGGDEYVKQLRNAQRKVIEANQTLERSFEGQRMDYNNRSYQKNRGLDNNSNLLDKNMLKELEAGQRKIYNMQDRKNKRTMLNDYFTNKKALNPGRISTAQPGSSGHRLNSNSIQ